MAPGQSLDLRAVTRPKLVLRRRSPRATDNGLMPQIATMIKRGILQKGDKKTVNGVRCREWLVTMKGGTSGLEHDTVCLGLEDHLPYEMTVDWQQLAIVVLRLQRADLTSTCQKPPYSRPVRPRLRTEGLAFRRLDWVTDQ